MEGIDLEDERRRLEARLRDRRGSRAQNVFEEKELLVEARPDAPPAVLRAQVRLWQSKHELSRERLVKLWLLYEDARREIRGLRRRLERLKEEEGHARAIIRAAMDRDDVAADAWEKAAVAHQFARWDEPQSLEASLASAEANGAFHYGPYTLYELPVDSGGGGAGTFYFFSRGEPRRGRPTPLPDGYDVKLNPVNGLPYVRKAAKD